MSVRGPVTTVGRTVRNELGYHFTHARSRETFLKAALGSLFVFGVLAAVFAYVDPVNYVFFGLSVGGFALFTFVEVSGAIVGFMYEKGVRTALRGFGAFVVVVGVVTGAFVYLALGGILVAGGLMIAVFVALPDALLPLTILTYVLFSAAWAMNGMRWLEHKDVSPPPVGLIQWLRRL